MVEILKLAAFVLPLVWAHRRARAPRPEAVPRLLAWLAGGILAMRVATEALRATHAPLTGTPVAALLFACALAIWIPTAALVAFETRRRDWAVRGPLLALAAILWLTPAPWGVATGFTIAGTLAFRWTRVFGTRTLFRLAIAATLLCVLQLPAPFAPFTPSDEGRPLRALVDFAHGMVGVADGTLFFGALALWAAFVRDPSLGIRTVGRRLALSHVLVVVVPLLLTGALWAFTTILGVNQERAMVAVRQIAVEGEALESSLRAAVARPESAREQLRQVRDGASGRWPAMKLWLLRDTTMSAFQPDTLARPWKLRFWADSLDTLPGNDVVVIREGVFLGAAVRSAGDSSVAAVALVPMDSLLARTVNRVADATIVVHGSSAARSDGGADRASATAGLEAEADSLAAAAGRGAVADSLALARARRLARGLGLSDSVVSSGQRPRGGIHIVTAGDTLDLDRDRPGSGTSFLWSGHALVQALTFTKSGWRRDAQLLTASTPVSRILAGMLRVTKENPLAALPIVFMVMGLLAALLIAAFDVAMVANMGRSITSAIDALKTGARKLEAGDLANRIPVRGSDDLWDVALTFNQAAAGLERARGLEKEKDRLESELALARQIQSRLLPSGPPSVAGLEIAGFSESAREVGGDYFDHIDLGDDRVLLVIADVSGKGVPAALLMSGFRASLVSQDLGNSEPSALAMRLNEFLLRTVQPGKFVTAFIGFLDGRSGKMVYANAGHNPPVLMRRDGSHEWLTAGGLLLGVVPGSRFEHGEATLEVGDLVALYTDGVTEGANAKGEMWEEERLLRSLRVGRDLPCATLAERIASEVRTFEGESGPADDITLVLARRIAAPPAPGAIPPPAGAALPA